MVKIETGDTSGEDRNWNPANWNKKKKVQLLGVVSVPQNGK